MPSRKKTVYSPKTRRLTLIVVTLALISLIIIGLSSFGSDPVTSSLSQISTPTPAGNITGYYQGQLPCADCPGIEETLTLAGTQPDSGSYILEDMYKEKSTTPQRTQGSWQLTDNILKLTPDNNSQPVYYQFSTTGDLIILDPDMQKIDSPFNQTLIRQN